MYISANLPERYGVFNRIRKDNFPFNQTFSQYIELIAKIGIHHNLNIVEVIGFIEDGIMGDERLPDIPEGDEPVKFRFKTDSDVTQQYYQSQNMTNRQITMLIIMMTLRLSEKYGTSLYRIYSKIEAVSELPGQKQMVRKNKPEAKAPANEKPVTQKPKLTIKKKKRVAPKSTTVVDEPDKVEPDKVEPDKVEPNIAEEIEQAPKADDIVSRLTKLTKQGEKLLDTKDDDGEDVVVKTNPALGDFFQPN